MAVIRTKAGESSTIQEDVLRRELARELQAPADDTRPMRQPIIFENEVTADGALHVIVVWERWLLARDGNRAKIIHEAYESGAPDRAERIVTATGVTTEEAVGLGLLRWRVKYTGEDWEKVRQFFEDEGAIVTPFGPQLRLPDRVSAEDAYRRLVAATGDPEHLRIVEDDQSWY